MTRHTITHANTSELFYGDAQYALYEGGLRGIYWTPITYHNFGAPATADADGLVTKVAITTGATTVLTFGSTVTGGGLTGTTQKTLDIPRNVTITTSDFSLGGGTVVAVIRGRDVYGATMWERFNVTVSDVAVSGKKAFKEVDGIDLIAAGGASGTLYMGFGNRFGLPFKLPDVRYVVQAHQDDAVLTTDVAPSDFVLPTYTATETHSATAAVTGFAGLPRDVRGTWKPAIAPDATRVYSIFYRVAESDSKYGAFGLDQAAS